MERTSKTQIFAKSALILFGLFGLPLSSYAHENCRAEFSNSLSPNQFHDATSAPNVEQSLERVNAHFNGARILQESFSRQAADKLPSSYVSNMVDVMITFDDWLLGQDEDFKGVRPARVKEGFWKLKSINERLLSTLHQYSTMGMSGKSIYWPSKNEDGNLIKTFAGIFRHWNPDAPMSLRLNQKHEISAEEKDILKKYKDRRSVETLKSTIGIPKSIYTPQIDGIPANGLTNYSLSTDKRSVDYNYSKAEAVPNYLAMMDPLILKIRTLVKTDPHSPEILKLLGHYYYYGILGHPFTRVNNSLLMSQINVVLLRTGRAPVSHSQLDYMVRLISMNDADDVFIRYVLDAQPK